MFEELLNGGSSKFLKSGLILGAAILLARNSRTILKGGMRGYLYLSDKLRVYGAEAKENLEDLYAEAKTEHDQVRAKAQVGEPASVSTAESAS